MSGDTRPAVSGSSVSSRPMRPERSLPPDSAAVAPDRRDALLGKGWRTSTDLAWTTAGDATGLHVLVASARSGYSWRTAATLSEPGATADQWIGNACLTSSGRRLVVVYAPRSFTNDPQLTARGGFTAIVDLLDGTVRKLATRSSLAYYSPGCGDDEAAVLTQESDEARNRTRLTRLDAATAKARPGLVLRGQVTSAVPVGASIIAARGSELVRVGRSGKVRTLARTGRVPFDLRPDADGSVVFLEPHGKVVRVRRIGPGHLGNRPQTLAEGRLGRVGLSRGADDEVFVSGLARNAVSRAGLSAVPGDAASQVSTRGELVVGSAEAGKPFAGAGSDPGQPRPVSIQALAASTSRTVDFQVDPAASPSRSHAQGGAASPAIAATSSSGSATSPVDADRWCSVPRNDRKQQAYQPTARQVEWAVDMAVQDQLHQVRPAGFKGFGLPQYSPQGLFPNIPLSTPGHVPPQILLGILAQESNLWQASPHALSGEYGNPLIGNFYGRNIYNGDTADDWEIKWDESDCGYGVGQVTDGMRMAGYEKDGETALPATTQRAVALDYATNIAASLQILEQKWNQVSAGGMQVNDGDPLAIENWFFAAWAYNTGLHPDQGDGSPWGLGWLNNPINPRYPPDRGAFLDQDNYADAAVPQRWPYQEKVLGWAAWPIATVDGPGYRAAWWNTTELRTKVKPDRELFCTSGNECVAGETFPNTEQEPQGPCSRPDLRCWFHESVTWKRFCEQDCGRELIRFDPGYPEQPDGTHRPPACSTPSGLPSGTVIVDDVPSGTPSPRCGSPTATGGSFDLKFEPDAVGLFPSKINFHQIGGGYRGHYWFAQTTPVPSYGRSPFAMTGTWRPPSGRFSGWTRIRVHLPDGHAWARQADYTIALGDGTTRHRVVNQAVQANQWVDLGVFQLTGSPSVSLSNVTADGRGEDIAFDAVAFLPSSKPLVNYVALGDSYSSGEGNQPYDGNSDFYHQGAKDACHRSAVAYARKVEVPGYGGVIADVAQLPAGRTLFTFLACGGALSTSVTSKAVNDPPTADDTAGHTSWGKPDQHWSEVAQLDTGYLDETTTLVSISIGGNDARFSEVLGDCAMPGSDCAVGSDYVFTRRNGATDPAPLWEYERHLIAGPLMDKLRTVYLAIHEKAPNAQIVVLGYPQLFPDEPAHTCWGFDELGFMDSGTQQFANVLAADLTLAIRTTVWQLRRENVNIHFVDPTPAFRAGGHWACENTGERWANGITAPSYSGSTTPGNCQVPGAGNDEGGCEFPGSGAFHPTPAGQAAFAALINRRLAGLDPWDE